MYMSVIIVLYEKLDPKIVFYMYISGDIFIAIVCVRTATITTETMTVASAVITHGQTVCPCSTLYEPF
jgi:hypothetical protein